mgnify:CR=1 FL=1
MKLLHDVLNQAYSQRVEANKTRELSDVEKKINEKRGELSTLELHVKDKQKQLGDLIVDIDNFSKKSREASEKFTQQTKELEVQVHKVYDITKGLKVIESEIAVKQFHLDSLVVMIDNTKLQIAETEKALTGRKSHVSDLDGVLGVQSKNLQSLEKYIKSKKDQLSSLTTLIFDEKSELEQITRQLHEKKVEMEDVDLILSSKFTMGNSRTDLGLAKSPFLSRKS